jgi:hypothetical protein
VIQFPIGTVLDEQACYDFLLKHLHPEGLRCPKQHPLPPGQAPHDRSRAPILDYRSQYVAVFQWAHPLKRVTFEFLAMLLGARPPLQSSTA